MRAVFTRTYLKFGGRHGGRPSSHERTARLLAFWRAGLRPGRLGFDLETGSRDARKFFCTHNAGSGARQQAFTLMELLVVITIMIFISTITLINVFGSMRANAYVGVSRDVYGALMNARQHACQTGNRTHFFLIDSNKFVMAYSIGTITAISGNSPVTFCDQYANLDASASLYQGVKIFDLDANATAYVTYSTNVTTSLQPTNSIMIDGVNVWYLGMQPPATSLWALEMAVQQSAASNSAAPPTELPANPHNANKWNVNDHYAIEAGEEMELPKGFYFSKNPAAATPTPVDPNLALNSFEFMPDGSVVPNGTGNGIQGNSIMIYEDIKSGNSANRVVFTVDSSGHISQ